MGTARNRKGSRRTAAKTEVEIKQHQVGIFETPTSDTQLTEQDLEDIRWGCEGPING